MDWRRDTKFINFNDKDMRHIILDTGLHCITDKKGHVRVYTEQQYEQLTWWNKIKTRYGINNS